MAKILVLTDIGQTFDKPNLKSMFMANFLTDTVPFSDDLLGYRPKMPMALYKRALEEGRRERPARSNGVRSMSNKYIPEVLQSPEVLTLPFDVDLDGNQAPPKKPLVTRRHIPNIDQGRRNDTNAIIRHRTAGANAEGTLRHWARAGQNAGTQFLVAKDGTIYETADPDALNWHVGKIRARCFPNCRGNRVGGNVRLPNPAQKQAINRTEKALDYGDRYPVNEDSVGIEYVGAYDSVAGYEKPTAAQIRAGRELENWLRHKYNISKDGIYSHNEVSYREGDEAEALPHE